MMVPLIKSSDISNVMVCEYATGTIVAYGGVINGTIYWDECFHSQPFNNKTAWMESFDGLGFALLLVWLSVLIVLTGTYTTEHAIPALRRKIGTWRARGIRANFQAMMPWAGSRTETDALLG